MSELAGVIVDVANAGGSAGDMHTAITGKPWHRDNEALAALKEWLRSAEWPIDSGWPDQTDWSREFDAAAVAASGEVSPTVEPLVQIFSLEPESFELWLTFVARHELPGTSKMYLPCEKNSNEKWQYAWELGEKQGWWLPLIQCFLTLPWIPFAKDACGDFFARRRKKPETAKQLNHLMQAGKKHETTLVLVRNLPRLQTGGFGIPSYTNNGMRPDALQRRREEFSESLSSLRRTRVKQYL